MRCPLCGGELRSVKKTYYERYQYFSHVESTRCLGWIYDRKYKRLSRHCGRRAYESLKYKIKKEHGDLLRNNLSRIWRPSIKERDGNQCVLCGGTEKLDVHHIDYVVEFDDMNEAFYGENMITLCAQCHYAVHRMKHQRT